MDGPASNANDLAEQAQAEAQLAERLMHCARACRAAADAQAAARRLHERMDRDAAMPSGARGA
jgi:uncharacterized protein YigA (DUF484 family)